MYLKYHTQHSNDDLRQHHFKILSVNIVSYDANWHSTMHHHNFAELFYCLEGSGSLQTSYGQQPIKQHNLILVNPYVEHTEHTSTIQPLKYLVIGIEGPEIILPNHASDSELFFFDDQHQQFYPFIKEILNECKSESFYSSQIIDHMVNSIILRLNNLANTRLTEMRELPLSACVSLAKSYIDNHFSKDITLELLEQRTHISRFHLAHLFKEELDISPITYLNQVRINQAKELLATTNHTVLQIAELVGFNSVTYFSTKFKDMVGLTPRTYRQQVSNTTWK